MKKRKFTVIDLFSGAGGMSYGFHKHPSFILLAAADAELGKPSSGKGKLQCNNTYHINIGIQPHNIDLSLARPESIKELLDIPKDKKIDVLCTCPPCTGFSRANPMNHMRDDKRNSLVRKSAEYALALDVNIVVMENARELISGNFKHHYEWFREHLENNGYDVFGKTYLLTRFGLPQQRERSVVIASKHDIPLYTLESLWDGYCVDQEALTVKRAFESINISSSGVHTHPGLSSDSVKKRLSAIPKNGGSWTDLLKKQGGDKLLTASMRRIVAENRLGSYPDVYGRMAWIKPAPTIKRECSHIGNGRYAHPMEDRLCSVREMAILQGFPNDFVFNGAATSNLYRHIGDAVPPLISYQLAHLCHWMLTGAQPQMEDILLEGTNLRKCDIVRERQGDLFHD